MTPPTTPTFRLDRARGLLLSGGDVYKYYERNQSVFQGNPCKASEKPSSTSQSLFHKLYSIPDCALIQPGSDVNIFGRAVDAYFKKYVISVRDETGTSVLLESDKPVWKGVLGVWQTAGLAPGIYRIVLAVEDEVGNRTEAQHSVRLLSASESIVRALGK